MTRHRRRDGELVPEGVPVRALHSGWMDLLVATVTGPDGSTYERFVEDHGRAVAVLPYNPATKTALLVTMPRAALQVAGGAPVAEAPAGMVEHGEDPVGCALRELLEETGLDLSDLEPAGAIWVSPGTTTERIDLFLAAYDDSQRIGAGGGLASENENITVLEVPLGELWAICEQADVPSDAKTRVLVQTLRARRPELFP